MSATRSDVSELRAKHLSLGSQSGTGPERAKGAAPTKLSPERVSAGARTSRLLALAAATTVGQAGIARKLGVSAQHVARWCDPEDDAAFTLRDLEAVGGAFARAACTMLLAQLDDATMPAHASPVRHGLLLASQVGEVCSRINTALADGRVTEEEHRELGAMLLKLRDEVTRAIGDLKVGQVEG